MKVKFLKNFNGSDDGIILKRFREDGTFRVPFDLSLGLARVAIENGYAIEEVERELTIEEIINLEIDEQEAEELVEVESDEDIIDIDDEEVEEVKEKTSVPKFVKNKDKVKDKKKAKKK
jgi:hypothetical protein